MAVPEPAAASHVPAWKRLGLKLKYAKDTADDTANASAPRQIPRSEVGSDPAVKTQSKRSGDADSESHVRAAKKRRTVDSTHDALQPYSPQHEVSSQTNGSSVNRGANGEIDSSAESIAKSDSYNTSP